MLVQPIDSARLHLSKAGSDGNGTNNCQQGYDPCESWDHACSLLNSQYNRLYISSGFYDAYDQIRLSNDSNIKIFGEYAPDTVIYYTGSYGTLFYSYNEHDTSLYLTNITYFPEYGATQRLVYFYYGVSLEMNDIIINGNNSNNSNYFYYSSYDIVHCYDVDDVIVQNVTIVDITNSYSYLFELQYADSIRFNNILVTGTGNSNSSSIRFGWFDDTNDDVYLSNIIISNYGTSNTFYFRDNHYVSTYLTNIMLNDVYGGTFFTFYSQSYANITMENIVVNGNDNTLTNAFLYYSYNYYGSLTIKDSRFSNFIFDSFAIGFNFDFLYATAEITIFSVTFSNLVASSSSYESGIIYIDDAFSIRIDNCTFENNTNFLSLIYCDSYSNCNINIENSHFTNNNGLCLGKTRLTNGIWLASNANGRVTISNTVFVGYPYIEHDSTSSFSMDNNTYSMVIDVNGTNGCQQDQTVFVSHDRCVSFEHATNENRTFLKSFFVSFYLATTNEK